MKNISCFSKKSLISGKAYGVFLAFFAKKGYFLAFFAYQWRKQKIKEKELCSSQLLSFDQKRATCTKLKNFDS